MRSLVCVHLVFVVVNVRKQYTHITKLVMSQSLKADTWGGIAVEWMPSSWSWCELSCMGSAFLHCLCGLCATGVGFAVPSVWALLCHRNRLAAPLVWALVACLRAHSEDADLPRFLTCVYGDDCALVFNLI